MQNRLALLCKIEKTPVKEFPAQCLGVHHYTMQVLGVQVALGQLLQANGICGANGLDCMFEMRQRQSEMMHEDVGIGK